MEIKNGNQTEDLFEEAMKAYAEHCETSRYIYDQPSEGMTEVGRRYVYLYNNYRLIAKYDYRNKLIVE